MSDDPNQDFEQAFITAQIRAEKYRRGTIMRATVLSIVVCVTSLAIGWGWGYNTRVSQECEAAGGRWLTHEQVCVNDSGVIDLARAGTTRVPRA